MFRSIKKKKKLTVLLTNLHIHCNIKNTIFSLTRINGNVLSQWSTKSLKKIKTKKNTPYNIQLIIFKINKYLKSKNIKRINIYFKGSGFGRYNVLKNIKKTKIKIGYIVDKCLIPFNGCRQKKKKRR